MVNVSTNQVKANLSHAANVAFKVASWVPSVIPAGMLTDVLPRIRHSVEHPEKRDAAEPLLGLRPIALRYPCSAQAQGVHPCTPVQRMRCTPSGRRRK
jgi:hypothetical protein